MPTFDLPGLPQGQRPIAYAHSPRWVHFAWLFPKGVVTAGPGGHTFRAIKPSENPPQVVSISDSGQVVISTKLEDGWVLGSPEDPHGYHVSDDMVPWCFRTSFGIRWLTCPQDGTMVPCGRDIVRHLRWKAFREGTDPTVGELFFQGKKVPKRFGSRDLPVLDCHPTMELYLVQSGDYIEQMPGPRCLTSLRNSMQVILGGTADLMRSPTVPTWTRLGGRVLIRPDVGKWVSRSGNAYQPHWEVTFGSDNPHEEHCGMEDNHGHLWCIRSHPNCAVQLVQYPTRLVS